MIASKMVLAINYSTRDHGTGYMEYTDILGIYHYMVLQTGSSHRTLVHTGIIAGFNNLVANNERYVYLTGQS